jgi:hypothetical protein
MKKISAIIAAAAFTAALVSCAGEKTGTAPSKPDEPETTASATEESSENATTKKTTAVTTTAKATTTTQPDPLGGGAFEYNEDGAVVFKADSKDADDLTMISAAQALFESACRTQWNFTVGCPFKIDEQFIETGDFNWRYYHISDSNIKTFADVEKAYHKVFSDRYETVDLSTLYVDQDGGVYALSGARGADIYYTGSKITEIKSKTDDEIVFTVENYYSDSDYGEGPNTQSEEFSAVIGSDNVWKAGKFTLPY